MRWITTVAPPLVLLLFTRIALAIRFALLPLKRERLKRIIGRAVLRQIRSLHVLPQPIPLEVRLLQRLRHPHGNRRDLARARAYGSIPVVLVSVIYRLIAQVAAVPTLVSVGIIASGIAPSCGCALAFFVRNDAERLHDGVRGEGVSRIVPVPIIRRALI